MFPRLAIVTGIVLAGVSAAYGIASLRAYQTDIKTSPPRPPLPPPTIETAPLPEIQALILPRCRLEGLSLSRRVISTSDTTALSATVVHPNPELSDFSCSSTLSFHAPGVDITPGNPRSIELSPEQRQITVQWTVEPRRSGNFFIVIQDESNHSDHVSLNVTNILGLSPFQAELVSLLSGFMGSTLTLTGLIELRGKLRGEKKSEAA